MKIVVDENIPLAQECFGPLGDVVRVPGRGLARDQLLDADVLIVRSVTAVNETLLNDTSIQFVGTATIGTDHVDVDYLNTANIGFANAPGCNATSVAEYVVSSLLELETLRDFTLANKVLGIVGAGNVGSRLKILAENLGMQVVCCDPPLAASNPQNFVSPDTVWQSDIVSLHVPYTSSGPYATRYLANYERLQAMKFGAVLINTSRGAVVDNRALARVLEHRFDLAAIMDVWEDEPHINRELVARVDLASPHIAGYSYDGKVQGTVMIYRALCQHLGIIPENPVADFGHGPMLDFTGDQVADPIRALDVIRKIYDIREDDLALRTCMALPRESRGVVFDELRRKYRVRREFNTATIRNSAYLKSIMSHEEFERLSALGVQML